MYASFLAGRSSWVSTEKMMQGLGHRDFWICRFCLRSFLRSFVVVCCLYSLSFLSDGMDCYCRLSVVCCLILFNVDLCFILCRRSGHCFVCCEQGDRIACRYGVWCGWASNYVQCVPPCISNYSLHYYLHAGPRRHRRQ